MKILIFTKNWLGDVLFEIPAIQAIRENFPGEKITALAPERCREILEAVPFLDEFRAFDERRGERSLWAKAKFIAWLRREKFDKVFLFHRSFTRALLALLGGIKERIGFETTKRKGLLTTAAPLPREPVHQVDYFLVLLKWAGLKVRFGAKYQFFYRPEDKMKAEQLLEIHGLGEKSFAVFNLGANWKPKKWPAGDFLKLAGLLNQNFFCPVVLTGGPEEVGNAEAMIKETPHLNLISFCGKTSLGVLGALYEKAAFVVSSDSGPLHIASGVGTPVVALFGPTSPELTGPRGAGKKVVIQFIPDGATTPWMKDELPRGGWMERILPEQVFEKIRQENLWIPKIEKISSLSR